VVATVRPDLLSSSDQEKTEKYNKNKVLLRNPRQPLVTVLQDFTVWKKTAPAVDVVAGILWARAAGMPVRSRPTGPPVDSRPRGWRFARFS